MVREYRLNEREIKLVIDMFEYVDGRTDDPLEQGELELLMKLKAVYGG